MKAWKKNVLQVSNCEINIFMTLAMLFLINDYLCFFYKKHTVKFNFNFFNKNYYL